jgi:hypothetical protein
MHVPFATYTLMRTNLSNPKEPAWLGEPFRETLAIGKLLRIPHGFNCVRRPMADLEMNNMMKIMQGMVEHRASLSPHAHTAQSRWWGVVRRGPHVLHHLWPHTRDMKSANCKLRR